jgi:L,D-transpeptidase catalytic domain
VSNAGAECTRGACSRRDDHAPSLTKSHFHTALKKRPGGTESSRSCFGGHRNARPSESNWNCAASDRGGAPTHGGGELLMNRKLASCQAIDSNIRKISGFKRWSWGRAGKNATGITPANPFPCLHDSATLPHMHHLTWSGIALHGGPLPEYAASHGCVRLPYDFAGRLFDVTKVGMRVIISPNDVAPSRSRIRHCPNRSRGLPTPPQLAPRKRPMRRARPIRRNARRMSHPGRPARPRRRCTQRKL